MSEIQSPEGAVQNIPEAVAQVYHHALGALTTFWALEHNANDAAPSTVSPDVNVIRAIDVGTHTLWVHGYIARRTKAHEKPDQHLVGGYITVEGASISEEDVPSQKKHSSKATKFTIQRTLELLLEKADEPTAISVAHKALVADTGSMSSSRAKSYIPAVAAGFATSNHAETFLQVLEKDRPEALAVLALRRSMTRVAIAKYSAESTKSDGMELLLTLSQYGVIEPQQLTVIRHMSQPSLAPLIIGTKNCREYIGYESIDHNRKLAGELLVESLRNCQQHDSGRNTHLAKQYVDKLYTGVADRDSPYGIPISRLLVAANAYLAYKNQHNPASKDTPFPTTGSYASLLKLAPAVYGTLLKSISLSEKHSIENDALVELFTVLLHPEGLDEADGDHKQKKANA